MSTWTVEVTIPPTIGAAIGFMMSDPTPVLHRIGTGPAMTTLTVISFGRRRNTEPAIVASRILWLANIPSGQNH